MLPCVIRFRDLVHHTYTRRREKARAGSGPERICESVRDIVDRCARDRFARGTRAGVGGDLRTTVMTHGRCAKTIVKSTGADEPIRPCWSPARRRSIANRARLLRGEREGETVRERETYRGGPPRANKRTRGGKEEVNLRNNCLESLK